MIITLTNASDNLKGKPVAINSNAIVSVYRMVLKKQDQYLTPFEEEVTMVFCPPHGTWEVAESVETIVSLINGNGTTTRKGKRYKKTKLN